MRYLQDMSLKSKKILISSQLSLGVIAGIFATYRWLCMEYGYSVLKFPGFDVVYYSLSYDKAHRKYEELNSHGVRVILQENETDNTIIPW